MNINFQQLVESSPTGMFLADTDGLFLYTNIAWQAMFGLPLAKSLGSGWVETLHIEDRDRVISGWQSAVAEKREFVMEFCTCIAGGKERYILAKARPLFESEHLVAYMGSVEDITDRYALQNVMSERERSYARLLGNLSGMAYRCRGAARQEIIYVSDGCVSLTGYTPIAFTSTGADLLNAIIHPADVQAVCTSVREHVLNKTAYRHEYRVVTANGVVKWVWDQGEGIFDEHGTLLFVEGLLTELTDQKLIENALRDERNLLSTIINSSTDFIIAKDRNLRLFLCNEAFANALGKKPEELYGNTDIENGRAVELVKGDPEKNIRGYEYDDREALSGKVVHNHHDLSYVDGELRIFDTVKLPIRDSSGEIIGILGVARDITEESQAAEKIWYQANYDTLTGLPNRIMFSERLRAQVDIATRNSVGFAVLFVDLDFFKDVNDSLGHDFGDKLLMEVGSRMAGCVRASDTVSRFAGDEFTLLLPEMCNTKDVERVSESILTALDKPFKLNGETVAVSASIGVAIYPHDSTDIAELLTYADQAMYQAKRSGRKQCCFFQPALQEGANRNRRLIADLRSAIAENQLALYYQPIVDLASGRINKAEALIRWHHPEFGLLMPQEFIGLAEEVGLISDIGNWVFKQAADQVKIWRKTIYADFQICINKSPAQFHDENSQLLFNWKAYLDECELAGNSVTVEITEGMLLTEKPLVTAKLLAFRDAGIQVALDDFGTGYSALSYLKKFDIDYIKIDRVFVTNIDKNNDDLLLCEAVIAMAHKLQLKVVAEGVETAEQYAHIKSFGCDYAQGYYFARPMPYGEFEYYVECYRKSGDRL